MRKEKRNLAITEIFMILIAVIWFIPIYYLIVTTLKSSQEATANPLGLPKVLRLDNYVNAWVNMEFPRAFGNTLFITATAVLLIVIFGSMAGYALARTKSKMGTRVFLLFLAGLIVPFQMNIVSLYKIVKGFGLMNTLWSVILVDVAINTPQAVFLFKEFIESTIPKELEEAAYVDGCGKVKTFVRIMLPDAKPMITSCFLFSFVWQWTDSFYSGMFLPNYSILANKVARLSEVLNSYVKATTGLDKASTAYASAMIGTGTLLVIIPLIIVYLFAQKGFVESLSQSGIKM